MPADELIARKPRGIILSGGPESVYSDWAPSIDPAIFEAGVPILGICYGAQLMTQSLGGRVEHTGRGEYGRTALTRSEFSPLFADWPPGVTSDVWMSHGDAITAAPPGFLATASTPDAPVASMDNPEKRIYGVQFHPEVVHTDRGQSILERFLFDVCAARPTWTHTNIIETSVDAVRAQVGSRHVLCALSGGVDSAVAAALVHKAVGDQLTCVFVDTGLMRAGEAEQVEETFRRQFNVDLVHVKAADRFFSVLAGMTDPEAKRKAIGETFIRIFEEVARDIASSSRSEGDGDSDGQGFLVQGTLYPDIIESGTEDAAIIKSPGYPRTWRSISSSP
jgi:GMP synthase (glutamine-hydrolysing)